MAEIYIATFDAVALAAATAKSVLELSTPATTRAWVRRWWVEFDGTSASNVPVLVELLYASAIVTGGVAVTPRSMTGGPASLCTVNKNPTGEGTPGNLDEQHRIPPTGGFMFQWSPDAYKIVPISGFWRIRCTAANVVNVSGGIEFEQ